MAEGGRHEYGSMTTSPCPLFYLGQLHFFKKNKQNWPTTSSKPVIFFLRKRKDQSIKKKLQLIYEYCTGIFNKYFVCFPKWMFSFFNTWVPGYCWRNCLFGRGCGILIVEAQRSWWQASHQTSIAPISTRFLASLLSSSASDKVTTIIIFSTKDRPSLIDEVIVGN